MARQKLVIHTWRPYWGHRLVTHKKQGAPHRTFRFRGPNPTVEARGFLRETEARRDAARCSSSCDRRSASRCERSHVTILWHSSVTRFACSGEFGKPCSALNWYIERVDLAGARNRSQRANRSLMIDVQDVVVPGGTRRYQLVPGGTCSALRGERGARRCPPVPGGTCSILRLGDAPGWKIFDG